MVLVENNVSDVLIRSGVVQKRLATITYLYLGSYLDTLFSVAIRDKRYPWIYPSRQPFLGSTRCPHLPLYRTHLAT